MVRNDFDGPSGLVNYLLGLASRSERSSKTPPKIGGVFKALGDPLGILSGVSWGVFCGVFWGFLGISVGMEMRFAVRTEQ